MLSSVITSFKEKYPKAKEGLEYILSTRAMPNRAAARIFLKTVYRLSSDEVDKLLPKKKESKK